jgi:hypothetical protein
MVWRKKKIMRLKIVFLAVFAVLFVSYQVMAKGPVGVSYTVHNLANWGPSPTYKSGGANPTSEVCVFCHTPHGADTVSPLWNKEVKTRGGGTVTGIETLFLAYSTNYTSKPTTLGDQTLLCMTCHDGVSSINIMHNAPNTLSNPDINPTINPGGEQLWGMPSDIGDPSLFLGTTVSAASYYGTEGLGMMFDVASKHGYTGNTADHPISINYDAVVVNSGGDGNKFVDRNKTGLPFFGSNKSQLECSSCHDPHVNYGKTTAAVIAGGDKRYTPFLYATNASSALCFRCHVK